MPTDTAQQALGRLGRGDVDHVRAEDRIDLVHRPLRLRDVQQHRIGDVAELGSPRPDTVETTRIEIARHERERRKCGRERGDVLTGPAGNLEHGPGRRQQGSKCVQDGRRVSFRGRGVQPHGAEGTRFAVTTEAPSLDQIRAARERLADTVHTTPVWTWNAGGALGRGRLHLKLEAWQHTGSFKPRGALLRAWELTEQQRSRGLTAVSAGNHAAAVAFAARAVGAHAKVVMPRSANPARVAKCERLGASVVLVEDVHEAFETVAAIEASEGRTFIHPFEGPTIALGTATVGLEWIAERPALDAVVIPIGGGGLCAGIAAAIKQHSPACKVYGVEPVGADTMTRSLAAGSPQGIDRVNTIADSLGAPHAAPYSFALCRRYVDEVVTVDDDALCQAMVHLFEGVKLAVEPAGAAATAAILGPLRDRLDGLQVGAMVCGANIDPATFTTLLQRGVRSLADGAQ